MTWAYLLYLAVLSIQSSSCTTLSKNSENWLKSVFWKSIIFFFFSYFFSFQRSQNLVSISIIFSSKLQRFSSLISLYLFFSKRNLSPVSSCVLLDSLALHLYLLWSSTEHCSSSGAFYIFWHKLSPILLPCKSAFCIIDFEQD